MQHRRVVITGLGAITAIGNSAQETFRSALDRRSGVRLAPELAVGPTVPLVAGATFAASDVVLQRRSAPMDRATALAVAAAHQAMADSGLSTVAPERTAVYWGTAMGSPSTIEDAYERIFTTDSWRIKPTMVVTAMNNAAVAQIALEFGITGPSLTYSIACASSAVAIGEAMRAIKYGVVDRAVVGGSEALLTKGVVAAWSGLRTLATADPRDASRSCKPFAADRSGFVLGEGAAALVLEAAPMAEARGASVYAELAGYGVACDAMHIADPSSEGQVHAITSALRDANLLPAEVGYINAHGTATAIGDRTEAESICRVFGERAGRINVSSTKALHGHVMGATGAIELVITTLAVRSGRVPPAAHLDRLDPSIDLTFAPAPGFPSGGRRAAVSHSFAFGGTNAVLVVTHDEAPGASQPI